MKLLGCFIFCLSFMFLSCNKQEKTVTDNDESNVESKADELLDLVGPEEKPTSPISSLSLTAKEKEALSTENHYAFILLDKLFKGKNVAYSPLSLYCNLGMLATGADAETFDQIQKVIGKDLNRSEINELFKKMYSGTRALDLSVNVSTANMFCVNNAVSDKIKDSFIKTLADNHKAITPALDFSQPIFVSNVLNRWVSLHTNGLIKDLVDASDISAAEIAVLINTLYFNGSWKQGFDEARTKKDSFTMYSGQQTTLDYMNCTGDWPYGVQDAFSLVNLEIGQRDNHYALTVILPNNDKTIEDIVSSLESTEWKDITSSCKNERIQLSLPKFKLNNTLDFYSLLKEIGIKDAFELGKANFSYILDDGHSIAINRIKQKTVFEIDEKGVEAASATFSGMGGSPFPGENPEIKAVFNADRPFIYVLSDIDSGLILFAGIYAGE
ncbi:MAG: hypothetical protein IJ151_06335 [Bacteroidales bacterium]|nr:hypothetical protein [Bacteroidales bacterium]